MLKQILDKQMKKGKVIIISAPSGAGKTTIIKHLLKQDFNLYFSVSATSRPKRQNETNGVDYYFLTTAEFKDKIKQNLFLEWEEVYENSFYGTLKTQVEEKLKEGKNIIFDIDVAGAVNIKKYFNDNALSVFIQPPSIKALRDRLTSRSSDEKSAIDIRIAKAEKEIEFWKNNKKFFDITIINEKLETALKDASSAVSKFLS